jgi:3'-phosphoadenosine 5'-phosphosulfate (PAPS) 3'-phosphatase
MANETWVTINGRHVLIKDGESATDAINRSIAEQNEATKESQIAKAKAEADALNNVDERDPKIMKYIPKKLAKRVTEAWVEEEVDYNEKTGKMDNRYWIVIDGEEHCYNNLAFMKWKVKEDFGE